MQNAGPLSSCSRESWTKRFRPADHHIETWRACSAASTASDLKNSLKSHEKPWDNNIRTSGGFYGLQTSSSSKVPDFDHGHGQVLHRYRATDYDDNGNSQENVVSASMASLNAGATVWPAAYRSIGGSGFSQGFSIKATESEVAEAEMARLLNARNADVRPREFNFQAVSAGSLPADYGLKMEEIARSNDLSVQTASAKLSLQRSNLISFSAAAKDVVKDSAALASGDDPCHSFPRRTDKCEESAAADHKRTNSALEDGEQAGPSKRTRTSDAPSKLKVQVRKENLGERITALQQLVSPFGKTDTASVLLEAIGYIKFLQDQVQVLSTPYLKGFPASQTQDGRAGNAAAVSSLRGRGLCLMPISSMQLMANDNGADYWASGIGGGSRF